MRMMRRWGCLMAALLVLFCPVRAWAMEEIDPQAAVELTIVYRYGADPIVGAQFEAYRVAAVDGFARFTPTEEFIDSVPLDGENWEDTARELLEYAQQKHLEPLAVGETDEEGKLTFRGESMDAGMYLVVPHPKVAEGYAYHAAPFLVSLPGPDKEENCWNYHVTALPKCEREKDGPTPDVPQTGLLWWPVAALGALGLGALTVGALRRRKADER